GVRRAVPRPSVGHPAMAGETTERPASRATGTRAGSYARSPKTRAADQTNASPFAAKTTDALEIARSAPPSAGPRNIPTLSSVLDAAFAAVSSPGEVTRAGSSADFAGRNTVLETAARATR